MSKGEDMSLEEIIKYLADAVVLIKRALTKLDIVGRELTQNISNKIKEKIN